jgi:phospholipid transport system substrate-binding protein
MLNKTKATLLVFGLWTGLLAPVVFAQTGEENVILKMLKERDQEIKTVLGSAGTLNDTHKEKLKTLINDAISFEEMGRTALGPHWESLTPEQHKEFVDVFSEIVRTQSLGDLDPYRAQVEYESVTVTGRSAIAKTKATYKKVPTQVDYSFKKMGDTWYVTDIALDEVGTAENYARSFQTVIRKRGFESLMQSLYKRLEKLKQK